MAPLVYQDVVGLQVPVDVVHPVDLLDRAHRLHYVKLRFPLTQPVFFN